MGGRVSLWLMPGKAEQLSHLEAFHMPVALTYIEPPTEVQARTGLLPVLSMPACNALEETFMARAPSMIHHTPQQTGTVNTWHSVSGANPTHKESSRMCRSIQESFVDSTPKVYMEGDTRPYGSWARPQLHMLLPHTHHRGTVTTPALYAFGTHDFWKPPKP